MTEADKRGYYERCLFCFIGYMDRLQRACFPYQRLLSDLRQLLWRIHSIVSICIASIAAVKRHSWGEKSVFIEFGWHKRH